VVLAVSNSFLIRTAVASYAASPATVVNDTAQSPTSDQPTLIHTLIDAMFAEMASDTDYHREAIDLAGELEQSDWEALRRSEEDD
jgi:uncharacterized protein (DUF305 family)